MRILIIEDDRRTAENISKILRHESYAVDCAYSGNDGLDKACSENYDLIILDRRLPDIEGIEVCRTLRKDKNNTPVLILTAKGQLEDKIEGLNTGADDYLTKPFEMTELLARIKALVRRNYPMESLPVIEIGDLKLDTSTCRVWRNGKEIILSPKEYALLEYLARFKGKALDRMDILSHVWDENADMFSNTVDVHIRYLRKKIDGDYSKKLIQTIKGKGYGLWEG